MEDVETGDILIPLIYMKSILEANYSRKLAALKNREVQVPRDSSLYEKQGLLFWHWAFECPQSIKRVIRSHLGDTKPQGHLRLVLLPIVYNALATKEELQSHPLFLPLHTAMKNSSYWPLLLKPGSENFPGKGDDSDTQVSEKLFDGPKLVETTALKYMFVFDSLEDVEISKRLRTTSVCNDGRHNGVGPYSDFENVDVGGPSNLFTENERSNGVKGVSAAKDLFQLLMSQDGPQAKYPQYGSSDVNATQLRHIVEVRFKEVMSELSSVKAGVMAIMQCLATILSTTAEQRQHPVPSQQQLHAAHAHGNYEYDKMGGRRPDDDIGVEQIIQLLSRFQNANSKKDVA